MRREHLVPLLKASGFQIDRETSKGWIIGHCPFAPYHPAHKNGRDTRAGCCIKINNTGRSGFNCLTCKLKGNMMDYFSFLGHYTHKPKFYGQFQIKANSLEFYVGADREFGDPPVMTIRPKPLAEKVFHAMFPPAWQSLQARTYLKTRGIGAQTCEMLGILYDPDERRIVFPVRDRENRLYGFTGRTILPENTWKAIHGYGKVKDYGFDENADGKKQFFLLGAHLVDLTKPLLLVEGLFALAHLIEIGADSLVQPIASMGSSLSDYQASLIEEWGKPVYLLYDRDGAGRNGQFGFIDPQGKTIPGTMHKLWQLVPTYRCLWVKGRHDPDDLTFDEVKLMVKKAVPVSFAK